MTEACLINGRIALATKADIADVVMDVINHMTTDGVIVITKGMFAGEYDEVVDRYTGRFKTGNSRQFSVYEDGAMEWYDFEPDEEEQVIELTGYDRL